MDDVKDEKSTMAKLVIKTPEAVQAAQRFPPGEAERKVRKA
jgi:hypothetical protein